MLGASSDHLVLDLTDAKPPLQVGDRVDFRLNYGAMLAVMTSEYVEKAPMHDAEVAPPKKRAAIIATQQSARVLEAQSLADLRGLILIWDPIQQFLTLTGYASTLPGAAALPGTTSATIPRVVGRVDGLGVVNTSTALTDFADPRSDR